MERKHNPSLTPAARELRKNLTPEEKHLWDDYLRQYPIRFLRQKVIDDYIVDFYCREANLVIEIDGKQHYREDIALYDAKRTEVLNKYGLSVLRFPNTEINHNFARVCKQIDCAVQAAIGNKSE